MGISTSEYMRSTTINLFIGALLLLLLAACEKPATENPLKGLKLGLWVPVNTDIKKISTRVPSDPPDVIQSFKLPVWIIENEHEMTAWNGFFFTHDLTLHDDDKKWYIDYYDCQITHNEDTLICIYTDAYDRKIRIPYIYLMEKSISPPIAEIFASIDSTIWGNTSTSSNMPDSFMFYAKFSEGKNLDIIIVLMETTQYDSLYKRDLPVNGQLILQVHNNIRLAEFETETYAIKHINPQDSIELVSLRRSNVSNKNESVVLKKYKND